MTDADTYWKKPEKMLYEKNLPVDYVHTLSRSALIQALEFRFNMINEDSQLVLTGISDHLWIHYKSKFLDCEIRSRIFINKDWIQGLLQRYFSSANIDLSKHEFSHMKYDSGEYEIHFKEIGDKSDANRPRLSIAPDKGSKPTRPKLRSKSS